MYFCIIFDFYSSRFRLIKNVLELSFCILDGKLSKKAGIATPKPEIPSSPFGQRWQAITNLTFDLTCAITGGLQIKFARYSGNSRTLLSYDVYEMNDNQSGNLANRRGRKQTKYATKNNPMGRWLKVRFVIRSGMFTRQLSKNG